AVLAEAAAERPLLVLVDDAHWLDRASAETLVFTAGRMRLEPVGFLFAEQSGEGSTLPQDGWPELGLGPLDAASALRLLQLGMGRGVAAAVAEQLVERLAGNPLALAEGPSLLSASQLAGSTPLDERLRLPARLERALLRPLRGLSAPALEALVVVAAAAPED